MPNVQQAYRGYWIQTYYGPSWGVQAEKPEYAVISRVGIRHTVCLSLAAAKEFIDGLYR